MSGMVRESRESHDSQQPYRFTFLGFATILAVSVYVSAIVMPSDSTSQTQPSPLTMGSGTCRADSSSATDAHLQPT